MNKLNKWLFLRAIIIISNIFFVFNICRQKNNIDWYACVLISASFSAALFTWLTFIRNNPKIDFYAKYSFTYPFFPMVKYPIQFWLLGSLSFIIAGGVSLIFNYITKQNNQTLCATILFWGVGIFISIKTWQWIFCMSRVLNKK
jgi:hypothetical protein